MLSFTENRQRYQKPLLLHPQEKSTQTQQDAGAEELHLTDARDQTLCVVDHHEPHLRQTLSQP
jgi:hypothetical protein